VTFLCHPGDLDRTGAKGVVLPDNRDIVVVRTGDGVRAYINACPHQGVPLETFPDRFLDADMRHLVCSAHGARFRLEDGMCVGGPCIGKALRPVPTTMDDGRIAITESPVTL